jgi:hypothetical protein
MRSARSILLEEFGDWAIRYNFIKIAGLYA